jgi:hypothetical protein
VLPRRPVLEAKEHNMARGMTDGVLNDPRWEGQDSQSLPDRPAHPDPSKFTEHGSAESVPSHGIVGHLDAKIGLTSDDALRADRANYHAGVVEQLEAEQKVAQTRADSGDESAKASLADFKASIAHHRGLAKGASDVSGTDPGAAVRADVLKDNTDKTPRTVGNESIADVAPSAKAKS